MPQMDDKVQVYFGRIPPAAWDRIADQPGATIDKAVATLAKAIDAGQAFQTYPSLKIGITKKVYVLPETAQTLKRLSEKTGLFNTALILAALDLHLGSPSGAADHPEPDPEASR